MWTYVQRQNKVRLSIKAKEEKRNLHTNRERLCKIITNWFIFHLASLLFQTIPNSTNCSRIETRNISSTIFDIKQSRIIVRNGMTSSYFQQISSPFPNPDDRFSRSRGTYFVQRHVQQIGKHTASLEYITHQLYLYSWCAVAVTVSVAVTVTPLSQLQTPLYHGPYLYRVFDTTIALHIVQRIF